MRGMFSSASDRGGPGIGGSDPIAGLAEAASNDAAIRTVRLDHQDADTFVAMRGWLRLKHESRAKG